jgi:hypothetical protein
LDAQRLAAKQEGAALVQELHTLLADEQAAEWGLTAEQYAEAKRVANPAGEVNSQLSAALAERGVLEARANDNRKTDEVRTGAAEALKELDASIPELQKQANELGKNTRPLVQVIKEIRRNKLLPEKQAQQATAQPAPVKAAPKGRTK